MECSEIRDRYPRGVSSPGVRCAPSGLRGEAVLSGGSCVEPTSPCFRWNASNGTSA